MTVIVHELTKGFPTNEMFGLTSQLRQAAVSVASNIAEGRGRLTVGEFNQFLGTAQGSNFEVQTQIELSRRLGIGAQATARRAAALSMEVGKTISSLMTSLELKAKS